jgi:hypothetical protein
VTKVVALGIVISKGSVMRECSVGEGVSWVRFIRSGDNDEIFGNGRRPSPADAAEVISHP